MNEINEVFVCSGQPQLMVDVQSGSLFVRGWDGEVRVQGQGARCRQKGNRIIVTSNSTCDLRIYLPRHSDIDVDGTQLVTDAAGVRGDGSIDITNAACTVQDWQGDLEIDCTDGPVSLSHCSGNIEIDASGAEVELATCQGNIQADTGSGNVLVRDSGGSLAADTGGGNVVLRQFHGPVHIDTGSGDVELNQVTGRNVYVDTGRGSIEAALPGGNLGHWHLETGGGDVELNVPTDILAGFELQAAQLDVAALPLENEKKTGQGVTGVVNEALGKVYACSTRGKILASETAAGDTWDVETPQDGTLDILNLLEQNAISTAEAEQLLDALKGDGSSE